MVFSSILFVFFFLPALLFVYYVSPYKLKNTILLIFSLIFYAWGEPKYILLMLISIVVNYVFGLLIEWKRKASIVAMGIIINLSFLGFYKYFNFVATTLNELFQFKITIVDVALPIGISFYTFQAISYLVDIYRRDTHASHNILELALFISFFPQLVAGPIVTYKEINQQFVKRSHTLDKFYAGLIKFLLGMGKKVLIANQLALLADSIFQQPTSNLTSLTAWVGILAYTLQIYFDFSGYSEMAMGLAKMFGFSFPKNFDYPYISKSVGEFWRRWHMTLGGFFRDYLYIPLGGSRVSPWKIYRNLFIVWLATGIWHGASWNFIIWGLFYGALIALERGAFGSWLKKIPAFFQHVYVVMAFMLGWVLFRSATLGYAVAYIGRLFAFDTTMFTSDLLYYGQQYGLFFVIGILFSTPLYPKLMSKLRGNGQRVVEASLALLIFGIVVMSLTTSSYNPFIYFRF